MKKIVSGEVLKEKMLEAINLLCDTVKCTLGPKGSNVIIDHSNFSPFITNDGVTIAESIESDDEVINVILELAKESSIVTNKTVGDGTTTTLVILQSLFNLSIDLVNKGENPIVIKKQLYEVLDKIKSALEKEKRPVNDEIIYNVARIASGDEEIAKVVSDAFVKIPYKEAVSVKEVEEVGVNINYFSGYKFQSVLASPLLLKDQTNIKFDDSLVLIIDSELIDIENISVILNEVFKTNKSLVIIANDFFDALVNEITSYVLNDDLKCLLIKISDYGERLRSIEKDLEIISGAKIVNNEVLINVQSLGHIKGIFVNKEEVRIEFDSNDIIKEYVSNILDEVKNIDEEYVKEFNMQRISMFNNGTAQISIGGYTKTELREKRMRLDDALCAVYSSGEGVLIGGGVTLLKVSSLLNENNMVEKIWKESLKKPFKQLMDNTGLDYKNVIGSIEQEQYNLIYNVYEDCYEEADKSYVVDSYKVVLNSLVNACSIASMLITTNSLVINEKINNLNKIDEYDNI